MSDFKTAKAFWAQYPPEVRTLAQAHKCDASTVTLTNPADACTFERRELTEAELRALFGDEVYEAMMATRTKPCGTVTVVGIDHTRRTLSVADANPVASTAETFAIWNSGNPKPPWTP